MGISCDVTRRQLVLSTRDTITGWRAKTWTETTIEGALMPKGSQRVYTNIGSYVRTDEVFMTQDGLLEGDEVLTKTGQYYEVHAPREYYIGDSFSHRECDFTLLPMHADVDYSTYTGTFLVDDARHRQKVYLEAYWTSGNCENDSGGHLGTVIMYAMPDYPLSLELKSPSAVDVILTVGKPESKPIRGHDYTPIGYDETVPVGIWCMDKVGVTAVKAVWQCEVELRRITEANPTGSLRGLDKTSDETKVLGSAILHNTEYKMNYRRGIT